MLPSSDRTCRMRRLLPSEGILGEVAGAEGQIDCSAFGMASVRLH